MLLISHILCPYEMISPSGEVPRLCTMDLGYSFLGTLRVVAEASAPKNFKGNIIVFGYVTSPHLFKSVYLTYDIFVSNQITLLS